MPRQEYRRSRFVGGSRIHSIAAYFSPLPTRACCSSIVVHLRAVAAGQDEMGIRLRVSNNSY
jgi:hypothetical protein